MRQASALELQMSHEPAYLHYPYLLELGLLNCIGIAEVFAAVRR